MKPDFGKNSIIEFKNVSFQYPGSTHYALKNVNITLRGDEKLCIVGTNGSGKSTFIKLLTRLYTPKEGKILLNGVDINEYDHMQYQALFSPVFQDFALYHLSLRENIVLAGEYDEKRFNEVCTKSGLVPLADKLQKKYEAQLYKWVYGDGFEPSGGEGQRIAIARAVYHDAAVMLLDEPTAALDPVAEYEIYTQFNEMVTNKTAVLITHRLSAVQLADKVAVFENGAVVEYGTHKELYMNSGIYKEMFDKQAEFYVNIQGRERDAK
jgi:ATP-binding cassette subfamily B protein/ATP-binding cassette subfamily C protein